MLQREAVANLLGPSSSSSDPQRNANKLTCTNKQTKFYCCNHRALPQRQHQHTIKVDSGVNFAGKAGTRQRRLPGPRLLLQGPRRRVHDAGGARQGQLRPPGGELRFALTSILSERVSGLRVLISFMENGWAPLVTAVRFQAKAVSAGRSTDVETGSQDLALALLL